MNPKTRFWIHGAGRALLIEVFSPLMILQMIIILKIYKWLELGPQLFGEKFLRPKISAFEHLEYVWAAELWPLVKWIPLAIIASVLLRNAITKKI